MCLRLFTIFVLMTVLCSGVLAGDPSAKDQKGRSPNQTDRTNTDRGPGRTNSIFHKGSGPQIVVPIGGVVRTPSGIGIPNATIVLMDMDGNTQFAGSASMGFFVLPNVVAGEMYVLTVRHPRYLFAFPAQVIEVNKPMMNFEFLGERNF